MPHSDQWRCTDIERGCDHFFISVCAEQHQIDFADADTLIHHES
jgi:hypothetical protein